MQFVEISFHYRKVLFSILVRGAVSLENADPVAVYTFHRHIPIEEKVST